MTTHIPERFRKAVLLHLFKNLHPQAAASTPLILGVHGPSGEGKTFQIPSIMQVGKAVGMVTLNDSLMELVTKKLVAPDEAYSKSVDKGGFEALLKRANITFDVKPKAYSAASAAPAAAAAAPATK